ncbi:MAG: hypothetical protein HGA65_14555 [Oscillochloris sp.]|nr:hypothetical protein [Oscillochloris sp.]
MKWNHTTESPLVDAWLAQQAGRFGGKVQPVVNEVLLGVAEGRLVDPVTLMARVAELERQNAQLYGLLQRVLGQAQPASVATQADFGELSRAACGRGLNFTK